MTKTLTLRASDIPQFHNVGIGFGNVFDELLRINAQQSTNNYPPYNIVQINENEFMISLAVAGFGEDNLSVTKDKNMLIIEGKQNSTAEPEYLHRGISRRDFTREFKLADYVEIENAHLELGILSVYLKREVPEDSKPKKIAINISK